MVDEPSKPHSGSCSSVGKASNSLSWVLPRRLGTGVYPSSQIYSSLYFVIRVSHELINRGVSERCYVPGNQRRAPPSTADLLQAFHMPICANVAPVGVCTHCSNSISLQQ